MGHGETDVFVQKKHSNKYEFTRYTYYRFAFKSILRLWQRLKEYKLFSRSGIPNMQNTPWCSLKDTIGCLQFFYIILHLRYYFLSESHFQTLESFPYMNSILSMLSILKTTDVG